MQPREDDDVGLRDGQRGQRRTGDRDPAVEEIVIAVAGVEARGHGTRGRDDSGIIRARGMLEVPRTDAHAGEFRAVRARIREFRVVVPVLDAVVVPVLDAVVVPVLVHGLDRVVLVSGVVVPVLVVVEVELEPVVVPVVGLVVVRDAVGVRREDVVQAEVQIGRDLDAEDPQHHREPCADARPRGAVTRRGAGAGHRRCAGRIAERWRPTG